MKQARESIKTSKKLIKNYQTKPKNYNSIQFYPEKLHILAKLKSLQKTIKTLWLKTY